MGIRTKAEKLTPAARARVQMIKSLKQTPARVGVSSVAGVGMIAIRHIKKGEELYSEGPWQTERVGPVKTGYYRDAAGLKHRKMAKREFQELRKNPKTRSVANLVNAYFASSFDEEGKQVYTIPETGVTWMHPVWFMNEDQNGGQNVTYISGTQMNGGGVKALRDIQPGEELFLNYNEADDADDKCDSEEPEEEEFPNNQAWVRAKAQVEKLQENAAMASKKAMWAKARLAKAEAALNAVACRAGKGKRGSRAGKDKHGNDTFCSFAKMGGSHS